MAAVSWSVVLFPFMQRNKIRGRNPNGMRFLFFQMDYKDKTAGEVFATVQFYYNVDTVCSSIIQSPKV